MPKRLIYAEDAIEYFMDNTNWHDEDGYTIEDAEAKRKILTDLFDGVPSANLQQTCNNLATDCISRQAAIHIASGYCHPTNIAKELAKLPSAQPEQRWIPCSERLPNKDGYYLVSVVDNQSVRTEKCSYDELDADRPFCPTEALAGRKNLMHGYPKEMTIAWMPLPEPYKGEQ